MSHAPKLDDYFQSKVQEVKRLCVERRRFRWLLRFAWTTALLTGAFTGLLFLAGDEITRNALATIYVVAEALLAWRWLYLPLRRPITDEQVALFIDENYPELQNRAVTMVSVGEAAETSEDTPLPLVAEHFLRDSRDAMRKSKLAYTYHSQNFDKQTWTVAILLAASLLTVVHFRAYWTPGYIGGLLGWRTAPRDFTVEPGDAKIREGENLLILVKSASGGKDVSLRWREAGRPWQSASMTLGESDRVRYHRFADIRSNFEYQVQYGVRRSPRYDVRVWVPPEVEAIDIAYSYPDYLDMPTRDMPNSGHIAALEGSTVTLRAHVNKGLDKATVVFDSGATLALQSRGARVWEGAFTALKDDRYHIELVDSDGEISLFNPTYDVKVQPDQPPTVSVAFPGRDMEIGPLDEAPFRFKVVDDFGLADFGIQYRIAGREPRILSLAEGRLTDGGASEGEGEGGASGRDAEAEYLLPLETLGLEPGDLITWTVWARDRKPDRPEYETFSDPFFLEVRPFRREFREAVSNQGAGGGMQGGQGGADLVTQQKNALIAVWNLRRRLGELDRVSFQDDHGRILEAQTAIRDQVQAGGETMGRGPLVKQLEEVLDGAVSSLQKSVWPAPQQQLSEAAVRQQEAYRLLLKLEPTQSQVARSRAMAGGMGGGRRQPGMDELELDRNRNFYEEERRTQARQEAASQALDDIRDLARRQKMINDEIAKLISESETDEDARREAQRRLERLREEMRKNIEKLDQMMQRMNELDPQLANDARQRLEEARQEMNRGLQEMDGERLQEARSAGADAAADLERLEDELQREARGSVGERLADLRGEAQRMQRKQEDIREQVDRLQEGKDSPRLDAANAADQRKTQLMDDKRELAESFQRFMENAADTADLARNSQEALSRKLGDWLRRVSREGLPEAIEETRDMVSYGIWDDLAERERDIAEKLREVGASLDQAAEHLVADDVQAREKALDQIQRLLEDAQTMRDGDAQAGMRQFLERDFKDWTEGIRNAENFLGGQGASWEDLRAIRREIERFRRTFRREELAPKFDLFLRAVVNPLFQTAQDLRTDIDRLRKKRRFVLADEGDVPEKYRKQVADYFEALSETENRR